MDIFVRLDLVSNFPNEDGKKYVIQGYSSEFGWQDSKHGFDDIEEAKNYVRENADKIAMPNTKFRIVRNKRDEKTAKTRGRFQ